MAVFSSSAPIRVYTGPQTTLRTIPNSSGTWTTTGVKWAPHVSIDMPTATELVQPTFKIGSGGKLAGIPGRQGGAPVRGQFAFFLSGTAGTLPDLDNMLAAIFGKVATVAAGVSVTYGFGFATLPFIIAVYNRIDAASTNRLSWGNIPTRATLNLGGGGYFMIDYEGVAGYTLISDQFSSEPSVAKAGLTTFPAEPTAAAVGNIILPYNGSATFGGAATAEFISAQLEISTGAASRNDGFADSYTFATFPGTHVVTLKSMKCADSTGTALAAIKKASVTKVPMDVVLVQSGSGAGYTATHTIKGVQFGNAHWNENGNALDIDFDDSTASESSYTATDAYSVAFT